MQIPHVRLWDGYLVETVDWQCFSMISGCWLGIGHGHLKHISMAKRFTIRRDPFRFTSTLHPTAQVPSLGEWKTCKDEEAEAPAVSANYQQQVTKTTDYLTAFWIMVYETLQICRLTLYLLLILSKVVLGCWLSIPSKVHVFSIRMYIYTVCLSKS